MKISLSNLACSLERTLGHSFEAGDSLKLSNSSYKKIKHRITNKHGGEAYINVACVLYMKCTLRLRTFQGFRIIYPSIKYNKK